MVDFKLSHIRLVPYIRLDFKLSHLILDFKLSPLYKTLN